MNHTANELDPITLETFWRRFDATVDELAATLKRTSFSTVVRDVNDYATAIFDARARLLAQSPESTPGLCGPLANMLRCMLEDHPTQSLEPGDAIIGNNPWQASGHHNDITIATPVFHGSRLIGFTVSCCHHVDIGGRRATTESRDNYEEGLRIPNLKIFRAGVLNEDVMAFIRANVRSQETVVGDLRAQFAANHVGARRLAAICEERGWPDLQPLADEIITRSERLARERIRAIPDGVYRHQQQIDVEGGHEVTLAVAVTIADDTIDIDFEGSSDQIPTAINCTLTYTASYTTFAVNCMLALPISMNHGTLAPLTIRARAGSILNCEHPAPTFGRTSVGNFLVELVYGALAGAVPDQVLAGSGSTPMWGQYLFGQHRDGRRFAPLNCINGGLGARPDRDGVSCLTFPVNVGNTPAEVIESDVPVLVRRRALWRDSAGAGTWRGGFGQEFEVEVLDGDIGPDGPIVTSFRAGRFRHPVSGILGGGPAACGELLVNGEPQPSGLQRHLVPGDVFLCRAPGGAGYGDPKHRAPDLVQADLDAGLISENHAKKWYL